MLKKFIIIATIVAVIVCSTVAVWATGMNSTDKEPQIGVDETPIDWNNLKRAKNQWVFNSFVLDSDLLESKSTRALLESLKSYPLLVALVTMSSDSESDYVDAFAASNDLVSEITLRNDKDEFVKEVKYELEKEIEREGGNFSTGVLLRLYDYILCN